jgi:hypothetical protein
MLVDIRTVVVHCGHCIIGDNTSHTSQQILTAISTHKPFDIISMDVWHPGITQGNSTSKIVDRTWLNKATLTCLCNTTGFTSTAFIPQVDAEAVTQAAFSNFLIPNGLPKMILLDSGSKFKGVLI